MKFHLSPRSGVPIYVQLVAQIKHGIASGRLSADSEMPAIRVLAEQLGINPNTVARAYRELENAGLLAPRRGSGTYVTDQGSPLARKERLRILTERIDALLAEAAQLNVDFDQVMDLMNRRHGVMRTERRENSDE